MESIFSAICTCSCSFFPPYPMASISLSLPSLSISTVSSLRTQQSSFPKFSCTNNREKIRYNTFSVVFGSQLWNLNQKGRGNCGPLRNNMFRFIWTHFASASPLYPWRQLSCIEMSAASAFSDYSNDDIGFSAGINDNQEVDSIQIDYLIKILHQSANSFSVAIQSHQLVRNGPELANAWVGVDMHAWHRHTAYQAAVYALLQTTKEIGIVIYDKHGNDPHPFCKILSSKMSILLEDIESQLKIRDPKLVEWFKMEQLPVFVGHFAPLLERWSAEYPTSGVAVIILAISCTIAVQKLGTERISCPLFTSSVPDMTGELMELLFSLVSVDKLHKFASKAGFEREFLAYFGSKVLYHNTSCEVVFWVSMVWRKLIVAFQREGVVANLQKFHSDKILERDLATLGLFAFLGRRTRLFLSCMGIKDLDEPLKDFLSYLECGSLFIYPELSSISAYELFMEVVTEEIGWLDFYAAVAATSHTEKRRSKQHAVQAKKEIILSTVFNVCSYVFSSFVHFSKSTQQSLDANLVALLLQSQNLLNICVEDYWAAYDKISELPKVTEIRLTESKPVLENHGIVNVSILEGVQQKPGDLITRRGMYSQSVSRVNKSNSSKMKPTCQSLLRKSIKKLVSTSSDLWMGTRLLFVDISAALGILQKQICGHPLTMRERKRLGRMFADITSVVPVAILMLIPVSAVGHAAILALIKKYIPFLIPSPYSSERLDVIKQLKRTKKMDIQSWSNLKVSSSVL